MLSRFFSKKVTEENMSNKSSVEEKEKVVTTVMGASMESAGYSPGYFSSKNANSESKKNPPVKEQEIFSLTENTYNHFIW